MEEQLKEHEQRIGDLEKNQIRTADRVDSLITQLESLTSMLKYVATTSLGVVVALLLFVLENHLH